MKQLITKDTAVLAKEKGFDNKESTQSELQKWLREDCDVHVNPEVSSGLKYRYNIDYYSSYEGWVEINSLIDHNTYEESLEEGLRAGLKLIDV